MLDGELELAEPLMRAPLSPALEFRVAPAVASSLASEPGWALFVWRELCFFNAPSVTVHVLCGWLAEAVVVGIPVSDSDILSTTLYLCCKLCAVDPKTQAARYVFGSCWSATRVAVFTGARQEERLLAAKRFEEMVKVKGRCRSGVITDR